MISLTYLLKRAKKKQFTEENGHPKIVPQYHLSRAFHGRSDLAVKKGLGFVPVGKVGTDLVTIV